MSIRLFMDHHVLAAITAGLLRRGIDVITAREDGSARLDDDLLLDRAMELDRVLFSQDRDLLRIANEWLKSGRDFTGLLYAHHLSITIGQAIRDLELIARPWILVDQSEVCAKVPQGVRYHSALALAVALSQ